MPKRKQPAKLITKDAAGQLLARRKRRFSHGVERQAANDKALLEEARETLLKHPEHVQAELWLDLDSAEARSEYHNDNDFYDRYLDEFATFIADVSTSRTLLEVAPTALQNLWLSQQPASDEVINREGLEERIESPWGPEQLTRQQILDHISPLTNISLIDAVCSAENNLRCKKYILYFAPLWIRLPHEFRGNTLRELVEHLFVRYAVPEPLYAAWLGEQQEYRRDYKWFQWFICYGQGGSLPKLGQLAFGWKVSKKFQHQFAQLREPQSIIHAVVTTEMTMLDLSQQTQEFLFAHTPYVLDLTADWHHFDTIFLNHWRDTARWIEQHKGELNQHTVDYLLNWSHHQIRENHNFSWIGRTAAASIRHADALSVRSGQRFASWKKQDMEWQGPLGWSITELNSTTELAREGTVLHHCIGGYGYLCTTGNSAIFSLRSFGKPVITIELEPETRVVKHALGDFNRACSSAEMELIQQWLADYRGQSPQPE